MPAPWRDRLLSSARLPSLAAGLVLAAAVLVRVLDPAPVAAARHGLFDLYQQLAPRPADPAFPVKVIAIDEEALAGEGQWPWPRTKLAELVARLAALRPRTITLDILLAEPDRTSPGEIAAALSSIAGAEDIRQRLQALPSHDQRLAEAMGRSSKIIVGVAGAADGRPLAVEPKASLAYAGDDPRPRLPRYPTGIATLPVLAAAAAGVGAVNWVPSRDPVVRQVPLLVSIGGKVFPSLALETLRVAAGESTVLVTSSGASGASAFGQSTGIETIRVGRAVVPTDATGALWLRPPRPDPRRTISATRLLHGAVPSAEIEGRHVIIGATAAGLLDLRASAISAAVPGVELHAQALEQLLAGQHLVRPSYAAGAEIAVLGMAGTLIAWLMTRGGAVLAAVIGGAAVAITLLMSWLLFTHTGLLFDPVYPGLSLVAMYLASSLVIYVRSEVERQRIRRAFSHYLAPALVEELTRSHDRLHLGGQRRNVSLLFADVRGFSQIAEGLDAEALIRFINGLFTPLSEAILEHRGTIDKFMGDAVMAFWNAPLDDPDHARNAARAALAMLAALERLNVERADGLPPVRIGIGLNTGECVVGNVGSPGRFDYSVLGDPVNVAARLEEASKQLGVPVILGAQMATRLDGFAVIEIGEVELRGKLRPERIFTLLGDERTAMRADFATLREAVRISRAALDAGDRAAAARALADCSGSGVPYAAGLLRALDDRIKAASAPPRSDREDARVSGD